MSYWISLNRDNGEPVEVARHTEGGTYAIGGITTAELNVTYNYYPHFDFRALDGQLAAATISQLRDAVQRLGIERSPDYWAATPGNAGYALSILLGWAEQYPLATWRVN